jgi:hypothetical protein
MNSGRAARFRRAVWAALFFMGSLIVVSGSVGAEEPTFRESLRRQLAHQEANDTPVPPAGLPAGFNQVVAVEYSVLLRKEGVEQSVDPATYCFQPGDQVRVRIQPLSDLYFHVFYEASDGRKLCLVPNDRNVPRVAKPDQPLELPTGGNVFEFDAAMEGKESLTIVASRQPNEDLAVACDALCKKAEDKLTPDELATRGELRARVQSMLRAIADRQDEAVNYRGVVTKKTLGELSSKLQSGDAAALVVEEPPQPSRQTALAVSISKVGKPPTLLVTIPLRAAPPKPAPSKPATTRSRPAKGASRVK